MENIHSYQRLDEFEFEQRVTELSQERSPFPVGEYFKQAWDIFKTNPVLFILFTIVYSLAAQLIILAPPLSVGYAIVTEKILNGEEIEFGDFFKGFDKFGELLGVGLLVGILSAIGFMLCIVPGIYLAIAWSFASFFVYFHDIGIWEAMEGSRKLITPRFWELFVFFLVCGLLMMAGTLACFVGLLVAAPIISISLYLYYRHNFVKITDEAPLDDLEEMV